MSVQGGKELAALVPQCGATVCSYKSFLGWPWEPLLGEESELL